MSEVRGTGVVASPRSTLERYVVVNCCQDVLKLRLRHRTQPEYICHWTLLGPAKYRPKYW